MGLSLFLSRLFRFFFLSLFSREEEEQHTRLMAAAAYSLAQPSAGPVTERASWSPCVTSWRRKRGKRDGRARFSVPAPPSNRLLTNESSYLFLSTSLYISSLFLFFLFQTDTTTTEGECRSPMPRRSRRQKPAGRERDREGVKKHSYSVSRRPRAIALVCFFPPRDLFSRPRPQTDLVLLLALVRLGFLSLRLSFSHT